jgi:hypothetical protein
MGGDGGKLVEPAQAVIDRQPLAEARVERVLEGFGGVIVRLGRSHEEIRICIGGLHDIGERTKYSFPMQLASLPRFRAGYSGSLDRR